MRVCRADTGEAAFEEGLEGEAGTAVVHRDYDLGDLVSPAVLEEAAAQLDAPLGGYRAGLVTHRGYEADGGEAAPDDHLPIRLHRRGDHVAIAAGDVEVSVDQEICC